MLKTPKQLMETVGIPQSTLRHWREELPPLQGKKGHACFSEADFLALMVVKELASDLKVGITALSSMAEQLWDLCRPLRWTALENKVLVVSPTCGTPLALASDDLKVGDLRTSAIIPIGRLVKSLQQLLQTPEERPQRKLSLPPVILKRGARQ